MAYHIERDPRIVGMKWKKPNAVLMTIGTQGLPQTHRVYFEKREYEDALAAMRANEEEIAQEIFVNCQSVQVHTLVRVDVDD